MDVSLIQSYWTLLLLIIFVGIVVWAFVLRRGADFEAAARIPFEDESLERRTLDSREHTDG
jgi:cytochrome c oxidase cbb3-type subunit 4